MLHIFLNFILFIFKNSFFSGGGSYRIFNSSRTQLVVQPSSSVASRFEIAHARRVCGPSFPSDAASDTVAGKSPRKNRATTSLLTGTMLPASEPTASVAQ
jgi:hypothetical protein